MAQHSIYSRSSLSLSAGPAGSNPVFPKGQPQEKKHYMMVTIWLCFLVASPFYVFASGNPQPGDGIFVILALLSLSGFVTTVFRFQRLYLASALFLTVVALVNLSWWTVYYDLRFFDEHGFLCLQPHRADHGCKSVQQ